MVIEEVVADKGYHSRTTVHHLETLKIRTYTSEPDRGPQSWANQAAEREAVYANRRRIRGNRGKRLLRNAANCSSDPAPISMRPVVSGVRMCAGTRPHAVKREGVKPGAQRSCRGQTMIPSASAASQYPGCTTTPPITTGTSRWPRPDFSLFRGFAARARTPIRH